MALNQQEAQLLAELLGKAEWPLPKAVFHALLGMSISVPLELCILDGQNRILLFERDDHEFNAILGLGTVLRDTDNDAFLKTAIDRLLATELLGYAITWPQNIGVVHVPRGNGPGQNRTRHEISLVYLARLNPGYTQNGKGVFYSLDALPDRLIDYHRVMIDRVARYLREGKPLLIG